MELGEGDIMVESGGDMVECGGGGVVDIVGKCGTGGREVVEWGGDLAAKEEIGYSNATQKGKGGAAVGTVSPPEHT